MTKNELHRMKPINNMVLVRLNRNTDEVLLSTGDKLFLDTRFHKERNAPVTGEVIAVPERLNCKKWMEWETQMELQVGYTAWWNYLETVFSLETVGHNFRDEDGNTYLLIPYNSFVCQKIGDKILMVNGYMLCEPVEEVVMQSVLVHLPEDIMKKKSPRFALCRHVGTPNTWYRVPEYHDTRESGLEGSVIVFEKNSDIPLEYDIHQSIEGRNKHFYKMQRRDVLAIIPKDSLDKFGIKL